MNTIKLNPNEIKGKFVIVIGPTGVGKTTYIDMFLEKHPDISVRGLTLTTRAKREGEIEGKYYNFISKEEFENSIKNEELLEYAFVHSQSYYGLVKAPVFKAVREGKYILKDIDYQGFFSVRAKLPKEAYISIFLLPPKSEDDIRKRIEKRAKMSDEDFKFRLESMRKEMEMSDQCDYRIESVEGDIEGTYKEFENTILNNKK